MVRFNEWIRLNKLKLNVGKTKCLVLGKLHGVTAINPIVMDGEEIEVVNEIKYLGIIVDRNLDFKSNTENVCKKVAKKIGVLARLARNLTTAARKNIYTAVIAPHFDYCSTLLFLCNETYFDKMQKLQSRAIRIILGTRTHTSRERMLKDLKWLTVKQRIFYTTLTFIFRMKKGFLPEYLSEMMSFNSDYHRYPTSTRNDFRIPKKNSEAAKNFLFDKGLKEYNDLPKELKGENCETTFRRKLKEHLMATIRLN